MSDYKYHRFSYVNDFYSKKRKNKKLYMFIGRNLGFSQPQYGVYLIQRQARFENGYIGVLFSKRIPAHTPLYMVLVHKAVLFFKTLKYRNEMMMYKKQQKKIPLTSEIYLLQHPRTN